MHCCCFYGCEVHCSGCMLSCLVLKHAQVVTQLQGLTRWARCRTLLGSFRACLDFGTRERVLDSTFAGRQF
jgi:hypothetical protein